MPSTTTTSDPLPQSARVFLTTTFLVGIALLWHAALCWPTHASLLRFVFYAAISGFGANLKVRLPGVKVTLSVSFFFFLLTAVELGYSQSIAVAVFGGIMQSYWRPTQRPQLVQVLFNTLALALSSGAAAAAFQSGVSANLGLEFLSRVTLATVALFSANTLLVGSIVALTQNQRLLPTLLGFSWSFPYYLGGAVLVSLFHGISSVFGWQSSLLSLPILYLIYHAFYIYVDRVESHRQHAEQMSALHLRTIEALALAIEAKDETTHEHLGRVQVYALEVGKELGLNESQMEALRAASLLHDIGKLAVPEQIINKPGKLTPEEFERMKIHPTVGAEILEHVQFPYPVVPIVRAHHEKWDGSGYPNGLKGEEIPIGARVISAVDCLDALASHRQYRRALPLDQAMDVVRKDSGRAFDPAIVEILSAHYVEYELMARQHAALPLPKLSLDLKVQRGAEPGAGFEQSSVERQPAQGSAESLTALARVHEELWTLLALIQDLGPTLRLEETMALMAIRLRSIVPFDGLASYVVKERILHPLHVTGADAKLFSSLQIPVGQGLSGWVAENRKPMLNGNPSVESGYLGDASRFSTLRSAASVPIESNGAVTAVLTLYSAAKNGFSKSHVRTLETICTTLAAAIEKRDAMRSADLSELTASGALCQRLHEEVQRGNAQGLPISVLLGDLHKLNDRFGADASGRLLESVEGQLRQQYGQDCFFSQLDGDNFAVVFPGVAPEKAADHATLLRRTIHDESLHLLGESLAALQVGVSSTGNGAINCEDLLDAAVHDLARAQARGPVGHALESAELQLRRPELPPMPS